MMLVFQLCLPPRCAGFFSAPVGLVDLDDARPADRGLGRTIARRSLCSMAHAVL